MNKYISICRNPYGFSVHEQRKARLSLCCEVERLQARVSSLECRLWEAEDPTNPDAFILRKQAEAVEAFVFSMFNECPDGSETDSHKYRQAYGDHYIKSLRNEADKAGVSDV